MFQGGRSPPHRIEEDNHDQGIIENPELAALAGGYAAFLVLGIVCVVHQDRAIAKFARENNL